MRNSLRVLRAERALSQADFAALIGVTRQTANALEKGRFDPSLQLALRIARLFERPVETIFQA
ncbi:helix-turn-helix transcriptional regulator [Caulobacter mirabilis]|uniref:Transcriptional regulator n=1 Tax=Caulobacter mirabilis TaxID=69666 RepID=A0A2D2B0I0_9CAUL|nr:helix-turn-helix transcriptional regulator [Caulobacter mirabilis]ATQ43758.1 transcriptional regulator [Caulobacter mirabilis]